MIAVKETSPGVFEPVAGNAVLLSLDGEIRAPLAVILSPSWTGDERAKFGIYIAEPFTVPDGKVAVGSPRFELQNGKVTEVYDLQDAPAPLPDPLDEIRAHIAALTARVTALEAKP